MVQRGGGGGCCIARYKGGGAYDVSKMDRILLRFRPIAPKPASVSRSASGSDSTAPENTTAPLKRGSGRRRRVGVAKGGSKVSVGRRNNNRKKKKKKISSEKADSGGSVTGGVNNIKTLTLLPATPVVKEAPMLSFEENGGNYDGEVDPATVRMKVECVTEAWLVDGYPYWMGRTDEKMVRDLEADTCPGFISDGLNRVMWTNAAYRRMVSGKGGEKVVVESGVALPVGSAAFTCRVRVVTCGKEKMCRTVPCDVWRMECGGIAWRLDTTAALSLWIGD